MKKKKSDCVHTVYRINCKDRHDRANIRINQYEQRSTTSAPMRLNQKSVAILSVYSLFFRTIIMRLFACLLTLSHSVALVCLYSFTTAITNRNKDQTNWLIAACVVTQPMNDRMICDLLYDHLIYRWIYGSFFFIRKTIGRLRRLLTEYVYVYTSETFICRLFSF